MDIPLPKAGHWEKVKAGKKVTTLPLPKKTASEETVELKLREEGAIIRKGGSLKNMLQKEIEATLADELKVADRLTNPDPLITLTKQDLAGKTPGGFGKGMGVVTSSIGSLDIRVAPRNVPRALRFMDTLIKLVRARGHDVQIHYQNTCVVIGEEKLNVVLRERLRKVVVYNGHWNTTELHPTGDLSFRLDSYSNKEWNDGELRLEDQLSGIIAKIETTAREWKLERMKRAREAEIRQEKQRQEEELKVKREKELLDFKLLLLRARRWDDAVRLRNYLNAVERGERRSPPPEEFVNWLAWAREKVDWYDPLVETDDELLNDVDRDTLLFRKKEVLGWR